MIKNRRPLLATSLLMGVYLFSILPAQAAIYQALCNGTKCTISVNAEMITSPYGAIPTKRVTRWGGGGDSSTSVGTGIATTILFGGIGLLGFLAKNHEYEFTINGYDTDGRKASMQIQFKNDKPAKKFMNELLVVTGLGMGQTRSAAQIRAIESGEAVELGSMDKINSLYPKRINKCALVLQEYDCSYDRYLDANPTIEKWAEANPELANKERIRLKSTDIDTRKSEED